MANVPDVTIYDDAGNPTVVVPGASIVAKSFLLIGGSDGTLTRVQKMTADGTAETNDAAAVIQLQNANTKLTAVQTAVELVDNTVEVLDAQTATATEALLICGLEGTTPNPTPRPFLVNPAGELLTNSPAGSIPKDVDGNPVPVPLEGVLLAGNEAGVTRVITATSLAGGVQALDTSVKQQPVSNPNTDVWQVGTVTTTATTLTSIVNYTVPSTPGTGFDFFMAAYSVGKASNNTVGGILALGIQVGGVGPYTFFDAAALSSGGGSNLQYWGVPLGTARKLATASDVITLFVIPGATTSTLWLGKIVGTLKAL